MANTDIKGIGFDLVKNWLLGSGIQSKEGGFYAWFDMETKKYSYLYSDIIISLFLLSFLNISYLWQCKSHRIVGAENPNFIDTVKHFDLKIY